MKKGFTLAEMLGVITILAILGLLIFPAVDRSLKEGKEDLRKVQISNIEAGTRAWLADNIFAAPETAGETMLLTLYQLKQSGHVKSDIIDPTTKNLFPNDMVVKIKRTSKDYEIEIQEDTGNPTSDTEYNPNTPDVELNGNELVYLEYKNGSTQTYNDPGVKALSSIGTPITNVAAAIKDVLGNVQFSIPYGRIGIYNIYYDVEDSEITVRVIRTVIVKDSKAPVITVKANEPVSIPKSSAASYNLLGSVTVSDESEYDITADRTNLPSVEGTYTVTYTATDIYGNTSTLRRTIKVI